MFRTEPCTRSHAQIAKTRLMCVTCAWWDLSGSGGASSSGPRAVILEDIPQFCLQLVLTIVEGGSGLLAPLSLGFTLLSMVWRGIRWQPVKKAVMLRCPRAPLTLTDPPHRQAHLLASCSINLRGDPLSSRAHEHE